MTILYRIRSVFTITFKRLWAQKGLTTAVILGIMAAVALIMAVPLYADAVYLDILQTRLEQDANKRNRPPFSYLYDYIGSWYDPIEWEESREVHNYLTGSGGRTLGLPIEQTINYFETERYKLFPTGTTTYEDDSALDIFVFGAATDFEDNINIIEGRMPTGVTDAGVVEVLITARAAEEYGLQAGETFIAYDFLNGTASPLLEIPVIISGIWQPIDEESTYWFFDPLAFDDTMMVTQETISDWLAPQITGELNRAVWYFILDGDGVTTEDVPGLISNATHVERRITNLLPNISTTMTPVNSLRAYRQSAEDLRVLMTAFNIPIVGLVLAFIVLIVGLAVDQRRNEIAVMRSRGATPWQIVAFALVEGLVLGIVALALGTAVSIGIAAFMGKTRSFLDFSGENLLAINMNKTALRAGLFAIALALFAQIVPTLSASRDTIITYKQEQARAFKKPWWQRAWMDFILLALSIYGFYLLQQQGQLIAVGEVQEDPFSNPLLFVLPTLAIFSLTLLFIRIFPWLMEAVSWILTKTNSVGLLLAGRELARTPRTYAMPLILLVLTVSLAAFTASLAYTVDLQLYDDALYQIGSDINLVGAGREFGSSSNLSFAGLPGAEEPEGRSRAIYLPMSEYLELPGVESATRVGQYSASAQVGGDKTNGVFYGIDRGEFSDTSFWRWDFADPQLNTLLNSLASSPEAILVSSEFLQEKGLRVGDLFRLDVNTTDGSAELDTQIVGTLDYFPTWYPEEDGPLFVGNLDMLFTMTGGQYPYAVWLKTNENVDETAFKEALKEHGLIAWQWYDAYSIIAAEQQRPQRQG
ncbi:MAG: FtsX-like permease family protein, partial [Anaerolineae bacterium]|nr:FtsX-like permease family protein [Anaerolineae bacterium]